jgi:hypothetical protein
MIGGQRRHASDGTTAVRSAIGDDRSVTVAVKASRFGDSR